MSKGEDIKLELEQLQKRVRLLTESRNRLNIFDGMNDGKTLTDTNRRLKKAKANLIKFVDDNPEYII